MAHLNPVRNDPAPIYTKSYALTRYLVDRMAQLCHVRYATLGNRIAELSLDLLQQLTLALKGIDKQDNLHRADSTLACLRVNIRLSFDFAIIDERQLEHVVRQVEEIGRMLGGWKRRSLKGEVRSGK